MLPLLATEQGVRLQVATGIDAHRARFGAWSGGFWLPECAYRPGLEEPLAAAGVRAFCVDQTGRGDPLDQLEPVAAGGAVAVPIDWQTISLVWDEHGYPADPAYRDYHAQTVNGMRAWTNGGEPYDHEAAARARPRARARLRRPRGRAGRRIPGRPRAARAGRLRARHRAARPLVVRGAAWLEEVIAEAGAPGLALTTLPAALERHEPVARPLAESSWGDRQGPAHLGLPARSPTIAWAARQAELGLVAALGGAGPNARGPRRRRRAAPRGSCLRCSPATGPS